MVKALLIDLDGTLVDSTPALYDVYNKFLEHYGKKGTEKEFKTLIGPSIDEIVKILQEKYQLKGKHEELTNMYVSFIMLQGFQGTKLFDGVKEFLEFAKKNSIKLAIVTSGTHALVKTLLDPFKIHDFFKVIVTSEDVKKSKPDPEIYQAALKKLGVQPKEALAIEDSDLGAQSAAGAGLKVLFLTHGKKTDVEGNYEFVNDWKGILKNVEEARSAK